MYGVKQPDYEDMNELFQQIRIKKMATPHMPLHVVTFNRFIIVHVGYRYRRDLQTVVDQLHKKHTVQRSDYCKHLWEKSIFK